MNAMNLIEAIELNNAKVVEGKCDIHGVEYFFTSVTSNSADAFIEEMNAIKYGSDYIKPVSQLEQSFSTLQAYVINSVNFVVLERNNDMVTVHIYEVPHTFTIAECNEIFQHHAEAVF